MKARSLALAPVVAFALLAGCTTQQGQGSSGSPMGGSGAMGSSGSGMGMGGSGGMGMGGPGGMGMSGGNQAQMCAMYRQMMAGKSAAEQQAAMESQMRSMHGGTVTPEQVRMHREMMEKNCAGASGTR
jgi:hypothetical protein